MASRDLLVTCARYIFPFQRHSILDKIGTGVQCSILRIKTRKRSLADTFWSIPRHRKAVLGLAE